MAYTQQQIYDAMVAGNQAGLSNADILGKLQSDFGVSPTEAAAAYVNSRPDLFSTTDQIMGNVNAGNYAANTNDPKFQARENVLNYATQFEPTYDLARTTFQTDGSGNVSIAPGSQYTPPVTPLPSYPGLQTPSTTQQSPYPPAQGSPSNPYPGDAPGLFGSMYGGYQSSPWLYAMADELGRRTQQNLGQAFNGIRSNAVGVGGLGGSRQGVAEGIATRGALDSLQGNLAGVFGQDYVNSQNRDLQRYGIDTNAYLTGRGQDMNFYGQQRGQDLQQLGLGSQIYNMGVQGGWLPLNSANNIFGTYTGFGTTSGNSSQGGGLPGAIGGGLGTWALGSRAGWW